MDITGDQNHELSKNGANILYVYSITLVPALGGLVFGFDTAVITGEVFNSREETKKMILHNHSSV